MKTEEILRLVRPNILALEPYSTARDEYSGGEIEVWLDANENPFDNGINRYPDPHQSALKGQLSEIKGVARNSIFIGNGSDEAIDVIFRVFARPAIDNAVSIAPTYGMYKVAAATNDIEMREVQLTEDFSLDLEELLNAADENTKLLWLCSPNNPTGNTFPEEQIVELLERFHGIVILDEAYIDFASSESFTTRLTSYPNLIVLQTLSKAWGMAGLRFGLAYGAPEIISLMSRVKYPYNINVLTQAKVSEMLKIAINDQVNLIKAEREKVIGELNKIKVIKKIFPTEANFVLIRTDDAGGLYDTLLRGGVIVRNRSNVRGCDNTLRITIGTAEENQRMIEIIKNYR